MLITFAYRSTAIYLGFWVMLYTLNPQWVAYAIFKTELTPVIQNIMNHNTFLRAPLAALAWYLPIIANTATQKAIGFYSGLFFLLSAIVTTANFAISNNPLELHIIARLAAEFSLGIMFLIATRKPLKIDK